MAIKASNSIGDNSLLDEMLKPKTRFYKEIADVIPDKEEEQAPGIENTYEITDEAPNFEDDLADLADLDEESVNKNTQISEPPLSTSEESEPFTEDEEIEEVVVEDIGERSGFEDGEKDTKRRKVFAKWSMHFYDKFQGTAALLAYNFVNDPEKLKKREKELLDMLYANNNSEESIKLIKKEMELIKDLLSKCENKQDKYLENAFMNPELLSDTQDMLFDVCESEEVKVNPWWLLIGCLLVTPLMNMFAMFIDWYHNSRDRNSINLEEDEQD